MQYAHHRQTALSTKFQIINMNRIFPSKQVTFEIVIINLRIVDVTVRCYEVPT